MGVGGLGLTGATGVHFKCHPLLQRFEYLPLLLDTECNYEAICRNLILGGSHQSVCFRESDFSLIGQQSSLLKCFLPSKQNLNKYEHVCGTLKEIYMWKIVYPQQKYIDTVFLIFQHKKGYFKSAICSKENQCCYNCSCFHAVNDTPRV